MRPTTRQPTTPGSTQKSPFNKENHEAPSDKKRKIGRDIFGVRVMSEPRIRVRQAFATVNARQETGSMVGTHPSGTPTGSVPGGCESAPKAMTKEDVEALLSIKMKGRNKYDFKGKCEQMMEYIKKLRVCVQWFQELEASYVLQNNQLQNQLLHERRDRKNSEDLLTSKQDELQMSLCELRTNCTTLEDNFSKMKAEKEALLLAQVRDTAALKGAEKERVHLLEEMNNIRNEYKSSSQQVASLQDINKRLQEYNASLQVYNSKLQSDAAAAADTISRTQKEKSTVMENLSNLRGHSAALQEQLDQAKASLQDSERQKKRID